MAAVGASWLLTGSEGGPQPLHLSLYGLGLKHTDGRELVEVDARWTIAALLMLA
jgi:hypothetical protein